MGFPPGSTTSSLVRESFRRINTLEPEFARQFYETLFRRYPQSRALFRSKDLTTQAKMMNEALAAILEHLGDAFWMEEALGGLGAQHVSYGVTEQMYSWVGECLLETLEDIAADEWSRDDEEAWLEVFRAIAEAMLAGAHSVE